MRLDLICGNLAKTNGKIASKEGFEEGSFREKSGCLGVRPRQDSSNLIRKTINGIDSKVLQLRQRWDNKLTFPLSKLCERYLRTDLSIMLNCILSSGEFPHSQNFSLTISQHIGNDADRSSLGEREVGTTRDDNKLSVLIESVHIVDDAQRIVTSAGPALVRLKIGNQFSDSRLINPLYLSLKSGQFVFARDVGKNGKFKTGSVQLPSFGIGEQPNDVVETRSEVVNDFTRQNAEPQRDLQILMIVNRFLPALIVWLGEDWVLAFAEELQDFSVEIADVLVGPL
jgi:hypothetical protein